VLGENVGSFTAKRIPLIAQKIEGLDMSKFNSCYKSGKYADRVAQDFKDAQAAGINGTPGFLISYTVNGQTKTDRIDGAEPFTTFQQKLEAALNEVGAK
jgi:predicted DsbA family dithiol-disulfide isomerase